VPIDHPTCRAAICDGHVTLNPWMPGLRGHGPEPSGFRTIRAALADLTVLGEDDELIVTPVPRVPWTAEAEAALLEWAAVAGHRRVWLPGRVVTFDAPAAVGHVAVDCPTCGAHWEDGEPAFWERVRRLGWFPGTCLACGGSLPEWSLAPAPATEADVTEAETNRLA
jgi:hypothetical protein